MADGLNRACLIGNLCEKPELRFTQGGQAVMNLRVATNESYLDKDKVRKERTDYHSCVLWGERAKGLERHLDKGSKLYVEGRLQTSSYDNREGAKVWKTEIVVTDVKLLGGRGQHDGAPEDGGDYDGGQPNDTPQRTQAPAQGGYAPRAAARPPQGGGQQRPPARPQPRDTSASIGDRPNPGYDDDEADGPPDSIPF